MTKTEIAYLAGIIDGEGSIMLTKYHKSEYPSPCISISSTDLELLNWIKERVGSGRITNKKNYNIEKHKTSFTYTVNYDAAIKILFLVEPYLVINKKKLRASLIINNYKNVTARNGKYSEEKLKLKEQFYIDFMAL